MNEGMLWFDNNAKTSLKEKIIRAADYYRTKYGCVPTVCEMPFGTAAFELGVLKVRPRRYVLPGHLILGKEA